MMDRLSLSMLFLALALDRVSTGNTGWAVAFVVGNALNFMRFCFAMVSSRPSA